VPAIFREHPFRPDTHLPREVERTTPLYRYCANRKILKSRHFQGTRGLVSVESRQQGSDGPSVTTRNSSTTTRLHGAAGRASHDFVFNLHRTPLSAHPSTEAVGFVRSRAWDYGTMLLLSPVRVLETGRLCSSAGGVLLLP